MEQEQTVELEPIPIFFGESKYVSWKDGETKKVKLANWGVYEKKNVETKKMELCFRCDVTELDGVKTNGKKIIDTTSKNLHKAIGEFLQTDKKELFLEVTRTGEKKNTNYKIVEIKGK